jgi:hypothetical protein
VGSLGEKRERLAGVGCRIKKDLGLGPLSQPIVKNARYVGQKGDMAHPIGAGQARFEVVEVMPLV